MVQVQTTLTRGPKEVAYRLIILQSVVTVILTVLLFLASGLLMAKSALIAGLGVVLANGVFAVFLFRGSEVQQAMGMMVRFYIGEAIKLILSAIFIAWAITTLGVAAMPFLLTFVILQMLIWPIGMTGGNRSVRKN